MKKIFAYTKDARLPRKVLNDLANEGYIPVPVQSLDCIRVLEPLPDNENKTIVKAALETIYESKGYGNLREKFAAKLLGELTKEFASDTKQQPVSLKEAS